MFKEFKEFAKRGNVVDLAVGVIIGAAFGKVVSSLVEDLIMPPIGQLLGHVNFQELFINLSGKSYGTLGAAKTAGAATLNYGDFLNSVINFLIVVFAVFLIVHQLKRWTKKPEAPGSPCCAHDEGLPAVRDGDSTGGEALRSLHDAARMGQ